MEGTWKNNIRSITKNSPGYPEKMNNSPQNIYDYSDDEWVIIGAFEEQYTSIDNYKKKLNYSRIFLVTDQKFEQPLTMKMNYNELDKYNIFLLTTSFIFNCSNLT